MRLGIGLITFNRRKRLLATLDRVKKLTEVPHTLVVADDGSTDGTADAVRSRGVTCITGTNMHVAWNKNRALFYLLAIRCCDVIVLLEDDCVPTECGWERDWIKAAQIWGHMNLAALQHMPFVSRGAGTVADPYHCTRISAHCCSFSADALRYVGYFDPRFRTYGSGHIEHSLRFLRLGFGGPPQGDVVAAGCPVFFAIPGKVAIINEPSYGTEQQIAASRAVFEQVRFDQTYRHAWTCDEEMLQLKTEIAEALRAAPQEAIPVTAPAIQTGVDTAAIVPSAKIGAAAHDAPRSGDEVFDEAFYLERYPDVARAVALHVFESGRQHYETCGHKEGRLTVRPIARHNPVEP